MDVILHTTHDGGDISYQILTMCTRYKEELDVLIQVTDPFNNTLYDKLLD